MASTADRHELYEQTVQATGDEVDFVSKTYRKIRGRDALSLREDFCGTAVFSLAWCQSHPKRTAVSVDLDKETLEWGRDRRIIPAGEPGRRVSLQLANVLDGVGGKTDIVCAFNFSYWLFETREALRSYFAIARKKLAPEGMLFLDAYGGYEVPRPDRVERKMKGFRYIWEQKSFNPINNHMECAISFEFPDGSTLPEAFRYAWRLWSLQEIKELLLEAGFSKVHIFWERTDEDGEGTGKFYEPKVAEQEAVWWTYIGAER